MHVTLDEYLAGVGGKAPMAAVAAVVAAIARVGEELADLIACDAVTQRLGAVGNVNAAGDEQKALDVVAHDRLVAALRSAPVALVASEEAAEPVVLNVAAPLAVAIDPLDGSSNIDTNIPVGTIFSILPMPPEAGCPPTAAFLQTGRAQLGAGFLMYGAQTILTLTLGSGTLIFALDHRSRTFRLTAKALRVAHCTAEFAINASNYRHWDAPVRAYFDDCLSGTDGPRQQNFNMRWNASLVAEAYRILMRGGVFLYPGDARRGYRDGRLRLVYEADPIAFLIEQACGRASTGTMPILDVVPRALHQRVPLIFGSGDEVERICCLHSQPGKDAERAPLFGRRSLLRV